MIMTTEGNILKMRSTLKAHIKGVIVDYFLPLGDEEIDMNSLVGSDIAIEYVDRINCIHCGRKTSKSFSQGYCYPCFVSLPQTDACVLHPEKCEAHKGISRDMAWSEKNCLSNHIVYLALTPSLKVGVTRESQGPTRWKDQGAWEAIRLARTPNRYLAGLIEVDLKSHFADKTNWRAMLTGSRELFGNLVDEKMRAKSYLAEDLATYIIEDDSVETISYPVSSYPGKVKPLNLDTEKIVKGRLAGIRGQYLIFESGSVLNIRKFGGYYIKFSY